MPIETDIPDEGTHQTATKLKADHLTDITQAAIDHQLPILGITLEADHYHAAVIPHLDTV